MPDETRPFFRARLARFLGFYFKSIPGWDWLTRVLVPQRAFDFNIRNGDLRFSGNFISHIDRQVYLFGGYEIEKINAFLGILPDNSRHCILDIGANVGNHSLAFSSVFREIHAFEPNPALWENFEENIRINKLTKKVTLHRIGLGQRDEELVLKMIDKPNYGLGTFSDIEQYDLPLQPVAKCQVRRGSDFLAEKNILKVDAIKIDVQGFEPEVLLGLSEVLLNCKPLIWLEVGSGTSKKIETLSDLTRFVPFKFCLQQFERTGLKPGVFNEFIPRGDYVIIPE